VEVFFLYNVRFTRRGETQVCVGQFKGTNPGVAYLRCVLKNPGCTLVGAEREGQLAKKGGNVCRLSYPPVSTAQIVAELIPKAEQTPFGFLKEISQNEKQNGDAASPTSQPNPPQTGSEELPNNGE
jgi:hypothetical protein